MISRRNFISIIVMMAVILFMFQFTQVIKATGNKYDVNEYVTEEPLSGEDQWVPEEVLPETEENSGVILLGNADNELGDAVEQWCTYTKRRLTVATTLLTHMDAQVMPEMILLDSESVDVFRELDNLTAMAENGVHIVFCNLPSVEKIRANDQIKEILGISTVKEEKVQVEGIRIFDGFLLGGEAYYKVQTQSEEEQKQQDLQLEMPWYIGDQGTKTYMVGIMDEKQVQMEDFPKIIWRNSYGNAMVFAVNGDYMSGLTALGILDAMVYEMNPYALYPVVNAQNTILVDCPILASENAEKIEEIYSRQPQAVFRDVMWPGIVAMSTKENLKLTFYFSTKYNYTDAIEPMAEELPYYLKQMKEIDAEAGKSLNYGEGIALREKMRTDERFYKEANNAYHFNTVYAEELSDNLRTILDKGIQLRGTQTLACINTDDYPLLSYYTDEVTLQTVTNNAEEYSYSRDLQNRSLITSLAYSNVLIHMHNIMWPQSEEDQWENYFDKVFSNVSTYWSRYDVFAYTTMSEGDARLRTFLNLDYVTKREENVISLQIDRVDTDAWFVLRTHDEAIKSIENAEYQEIESGAYLIHTLSDQVKIYLEKSDEVLELSDVFDFEG